MEHLSNQTNWAERLNDLIGMRAEPTLERSSPRRVAPRLREDEVGELVRGYQEGSSVYELADRFAIHRGTMSRYLHRVGVAIRGRGLGE